MVLLTDAPTVMHDRDAGVAGAEVFNEPIAAAAGGGRVIQLENCIEDVLGYDPPSKDKPFVAYWKTLEWGTTWETVPEAWRKIIAKTFDGYI